MLDTDSGTAVIASSGPVAMPAPSLNIVSADGDASGDTPTIIKTARHIFCVEFARLRSGIAIFGNAKTWWRKAKGLYAEETTPHKGAVMVFAAKKGMKDGHLAVVTKILSSREIRVDHANWGRDGDIYLNAPVIDVSANNDWSKVRVWNTRLGQMGSGVFPIKGFVSLRSTAMNERSSAPVD